MSHPARFTGLKLAGTDLRALREMQAKGKKLTARSWRRIRTLLLLNEGMTVTDTARAVGGYKREVSRVGKRYLARGLQAALSDDPRPKPARMLDSVQEAAVVALACGPAPEGYARWSTALLAEEAKRRKIVERIGRETIRLVLVNHDLKPWREKNVVRAGNQPGVR
jgi:hypothetical protein